MIRAILFAGAVQLVMSTTTFACDGQSGSVIYEDHFADDAGGWDLAPPAPTIMPPAMIMAPGSQDSVTIHSQVLTFNATDGDYCAEIVLPASPAADNLVGFGIEFWATDYQNLMAYILSTDKSLALWKLSDGTWSQIASIPDSEAFDATPGATNSLRVVVKESKITLMLNGTELKAIRAQTPAGNLRFGVYAQIDKSLEVPPEIQVTSFAVTSGE